jgi:hypothetical protein
MAAEVSEPEMSGVDAHKVWRSVAEPWPDSRVRAGGIPPRPRACEASTATTPNILFYLIVCRSTRPRGDRLPGATNPQFG